MMNENRPRAKPLITDSEDIEGKGNIIKAWGGGEWMGYINKK